MGADRIRVLVAIADGRPLPSPGLPTSRYNYVGLSGPSQGWLHSPDQGLSRIHIWSYYPTGRYYFLERRSVYMAIAQDTTQVVAQIDAVLQSIGGTDATAIERQITQCFAIINRVAGPHSVYAERAKAVMETKPLNNFRGNFRYLLAGILEALKFDVENGILTSFEELIHADLFSDYLEMSRYLVEGDYKDAAAVMAGGTLEGHLRQLCIKHNIPLEELTSRGTTPKTGGMLNADLYKQKVYPNADQQQVTAWLAIRNSAAHADYGNYTKAQVELLIQGLRDFIRRYPA
jgi:hypothetical protein